MNNYHQPVLVHEILDALGVREGGRYIDATLGDGGHAKAIVQRGGIVLGIDQDPEAIERARKRLQIEVGREQVKMANTNFEHLSEIAQKEGFNPVDGILFDLGMSSYQLASGRGFSFQSNEPLDMRMDPSRSVTAADLINALGRKELSDLFMKYGHESHAVRIASSIIGARQISPIKTTRQLAELIERISPRKGKLHPATKVFMSLRMAVNDELDVLQNALPQAAMLLIEGGRLGVISFHEGEDRIVKTFFRTYGELEEISESPIGPSLEEIQHNPRSRSARLRVAQKRQGE